MKTVNEVFTALQAYYAKQHPYLSASQGEGFLSAIRIVAQIMKEDAK